MFIEFIRTFTIHCMYVVDDVEVDKETEDSLLKEDDKEAFMETEEYKVWLTF